MVDMPEHPLRFRYPSSAETRARRTGRRSTVEDDALDVRPVRQANYE